MTGQDFERSIVHAFNDYAANYDKRLIAYRHFQMRYQPQLFDVLVDSGCPNRYMAIECKSIDPSTCSALYFKQHFSTTKGVHQVERETEWLDKSGRDGYLVVELRRGKGNKTACYFVPWYVVTAAFNLGKVGLSFARIMDCPSCNKTCGKYIFDDEFIDQITNSEKEFVEC